MKANPRLFLIFIFLVGLLAIQPVRPAYAASIVVDSNTDSTSPSTDSFCTLREAIANANNDAATYPDCTAGSGTDTISFHPALSGATINLQSTLSITSSMTIDGSSLASQIIISGDSNNNGTGDVQVINISGSPTVTLDSLKITKGSATTAGGIYNTSATAMLTITNSTIYDNRATSGPGGGIRNEGTLTITNSTISGNTASNSGGGIRNGNLSATLTISNSTISGNTSTGGSGGGIYNVNGYLSVTITNSTISGNSAAGSGGGVFYETSGTLNYANTIIANNTVNTNPNDCAGSGTIGTNTNNLVEDASCSTNGTNFLSGDPNLGPLANNGGATQTHALYPGSTAIDAGDNATCAASPINNLDQRGTTRPYNTVCDIGAYERTDNVSPTLDSFAATSPSTSLNIPITDFTASDDVLLSAYLITTSATTPSATDLGWMSSAPSTYTVGVDGNYDLYPWARDAAGNISTLYGSPVSVTVDATPPVVSSSVRVNSSPTTANSVDFTVTFSESVSGVDTSDFSLNTTGTISGASVSGVSGSGTTYTVSVNTGTGDGNLRLDVLDDNSIIDAVTNPLNSAFTSGETYAVDKNAPTIDSFTATSPSTSLTVAITAFSASDTIGVTGYMITETNTQPAAGDAGWTGSPPSTHTVASDGAYTLYPWAKDATGNVSSLYGSPANVLVDTTAPTISSSVRADSNPTNATDVDFTVTFSESVSGVDLTDFALTSSGGVSGASISGVSGSGASYTVSVATGSGDGTIRLDVLDDNSIVDIASNTLNGGLTSGESYTTDKTAPTVSLSSTTGNPTNTNPIPVTVTFSESVTGFTSGDITPGNASVSNFAGSGNSYSFDLTPTGDGSITADIAASVAGDTAGNGNTVATQFIRTYDSTAPTVSSVARANTNPSNANSVDFTVTFSESVTGVDTADFSLTTTGVSGAAVSGVSGSGATRTVSVNTGSGNGTIRLDLSVSASASDAAGNTLSGLPFTSGQSYTINKTVTLTLMSNAAQDGWLLESSETSGMGGTLNSAATTFNLGDDATKKQYRGLLSFTTSGIPDTAVITSVTLKVRRNTVVGGGNPLSIFQGFMADVKTGFFSASALQITDFQTAGSKTIGPTSPALVSNWYSLNLSNAKTFINKLSSNVGLTQIRLRFKLDDNNNTTANYLSLFSGNAGAANRPQLVITYYVP